MSSNIEYCTNIEFRVDFGIEVEVVLLRCLDVVPLVFLIGRFLVIDVWLGEDQKLNTNQNICLKGMTLCLH